METKLTKQEYYKQRQYCPKCASTQHDETEMFYQFDENDYENFQDLNTCNCYICGDTHTIHDRVLSTGTEPYKKIHDDIYNIFSNKEITLDEKFNNFNDFMKPFIEERNQGLLRTILINGKSFKNNPIVKYRLEQIAQQLRDVSGRTMI